ncbi:MAG: hypothetical protein QOH58_145 [Thermoleophilaceae bacterium]|jgi:ubiquinone/menaquinone biosynthesis C-methylase UbiE|nr:hypothetical protein [Thermoleophilaceae bacterium]
METPAQRRFELSEDEKEKVQEVRQRPPSAREVLGILAGSPRLALELAQAGVRGATQAMRSDPALVWALDTERVRKVVPDAAHGAVGYGADAFVNTLLPHLAPENRLLEIGAGGGRVGRMVAPHVAHVTLSDISEAVVGEARANLADLSNVDFVTTRGFRLEGLPDNAFDVVFGHDVFVHFEPNITLALFDAAKRKLKTDGLLAASFFTIDRSQWRAEHLRVVRQAAAKGRFGSSLPQPYSPEQVRLLLESVGFDLVEDGHPVAERSSGRHYVVIARARRAG